MMTPQPQTLPGFDLSTIVDQASTLEDLSEAKSYTAERLLVSHPDRYKIARALFFEVGLSKRAICDLCRLNSRTLNALIEREINTRGAEFLYERIRRKKALIAYQLTEQLEDLANDPKACQAAGINGLINAIKLIQASTGPTVDVESSSNTSGSNPSGIDYVTAYKLANSDSNGLEMRKNLAPRLDVRRDDGHDANADHEETPSNDNLHGIDSILPSNGR